MNRNEAAKNLSECIKYVMAWMDENDITINGDNATMAMCSALMSVTEGFIKKIRNDTVSEYDCEAYAGLILASRIVEQVVKDEGVDEVTLKAEFVSYDDMIRRKAQAEVDEMKAEGDY